MPRRDHTKKVTMESDLSTALEMIAPREIVCRAHSVPAATFLFLISAAALKPEIAFEPERVANAMNTGVGRGGVGRGSELYTLLSIPAKWYDKEKLLTSNAVHTQNSATASIWNHPSPPFPPFSYQAVRR